MGLFNKIFLLYLTISIALFMYNPTALVGNNSYTFLSWFGINGNGTDPNAATLNETSAYSGDMNSTYSSLFAQGRTVNKDANSINIFMVIIDPIWQVLSLLWLLFKMLFIPLIALSTAGVPFVWILMLGVPINVLGLLALVMIIRGYG